MNNRNRMFALAVNNMVKEALDLALNEERKNLRTLGKTEPEINILLLQIRSKVEVQLLNEAKETLTRNIQEIEAQEKASNDARIKPIK
jgi:hypothetical protein